jgi:RNA polymerase sigma-70 factor (ECF subfamily)
LKPGEVFGHQSKVAALFRRRKNDSRQFSDSPDLVAASTVLAAPEERQETSLRLLATAASNADDDLAPSAVPSDDMIDDDDELQLVNPAAAYASDDSFDEQLPLHYYDDEDDLGDFDDLGDLEIEGTPSPVRPASPLPVRPPSIDRPTPAPLAAIADTVPREETNRPVSRAPLEVEAETSTSEKALLEAAIPETTPPERWSSDGERHQPSSQSLPEPDSGGADTPTERFNLSAAREEGLEEASFGRVDSTLALQPIPELQGVPPLLSDDSENERADNPVLDLDEDLTEDLDSDAVDLTDSVLETEIAVTSLPDPDPIERDETVAEDVDDDWHARLAELLIADDQEEKSESHSAAQKRKAGADDQDEDDIPTPSILFRSTPIEQDDSPTTETPKPALSVPGTSQASDASAPDGKADADEAYDDDDEPIPPALLARSPLDNRRPLPSASPSVADSLTPEQLRMAIIAMVPRLRRFAAALIGNEQQADDLVQVTIDTLLADPEGLGAAPDLNLAILTSLYGKRQEMTRQGSSETRAASSARSFETMLCRRLAGADQFEITEFARAIYDLDEKGRAPLLLVVLENLSYRDVASVMNMAPDRIMDCVAQSRVRLRQMLSDGDVSMMEGSLVHEHMHEMETEINGYLDGELDDTSMAGVDTLIEHDEDAADRLLQYGIQGDLIRRLYAPLLNRPIPTAMLQSISSTVRRTNRLGFGFGFSKKKPLIAGMILVLAAGLAFSWPYLTSSIGSLVPEALAISSRIDIG